MDAVKRDACPTCSACRPACAVNLTFDQSTYIRQSIQSLWHEASIGSVLAFLVILLFLRSFVSTVIISIAIPLSLLLTLVAMYMLGQTLNIFTLGGLALAVGRLVDDSIVELENINRHLNMPGKPRRLAVLDAAREVAMPIFVSTITTIVVFLPTVFLEGQAKLLFIPLTFTISCSLFASFLVSRTVTPLLCLHWLRPEAPATRRNLYTRALAWSGRILERLDELYQRALGWALGHRKTLIGGILAVAATRGGDPAAHRDRVLPALGREPVHHPRPRARRHPGRGDGADRGRGWRGSSGPRSRPGEFTSIVSTVGVPSGRSGVFSQNTGPHAAQLQVYLSHPDKRKRNDRDIVAAIRPKFGGQFPGTTYQVQFGGIVSRILNFGAAGAHRGGAARLRPEGRPGGGAGGRAHAPGDAGASPTSSSAARRTTRSSTSWWTGRRRRRPGSPSGTSPRPPCSPSTATSA